MNCNLHQKFKKLDEVLKISKFLKMSNIYIYIYMDSEKYKIYMLFSIKTEGGVVFYILNNKILQEKQFYNFYKVQYLRIYKGNVLGMFHLYYILTYKYLTYFIH